MTQRISECRRHGIPTVPTTGVPYYVARCAHFGERFVVQINANDSGFIIVDYVEDLPDGDVLVEGHYPGLFDEELDELWQELTARMLANDPPRREA